MHEIKLPQMGQSVEEASIVKWFKNEGDRVERGEPLFSIQTDKAEVECESPESGVLRKILLEPDVVVAVLSIVALVGEPDEPLPDLAAAPPTAAPEKAAEKVPQEAPRARTASTPSLPAAAPTAKTEHVGVSPRARRRAEELHVNPAHVQGSGACGRVIEEDVLARAEALGSAHASPTARRLGELEGVDVTRLQGTGLGGKVMKRDVLSAEGAGPIVPGGSQRIPLSPMRRVIAKRMVESKFSAPHYYITVEVDMAAAKTFRTRDAGFKPSFNDLVLRATIKAIQAFPLVNARWTEDAIEVQGDINLGMAVALPNGLIVPVLKQAQRMSLQQISETCKLLAEKARTGKLSPEDYSGNTFTISNLGALGVDQFTAIINQPDSAILAVGQMRDRPVVIDGGIHVRPIMKMTLSSDHRVIDGAVAAQFMGKLRELMESADF